MNPSQPATRSPQRLTSHDFVFIAVCVTLAAACVVIVANYFSAAFPQAAIDFRYDRDTSRPLAEQLLAAERVNVSGMKHAVRFDFDNQARIFLERTLGVEASQQVLRDRVRIWSWHHRWFRPLVEEEVSVDVAPTGEIIGYRHVLPEDRAAGGSRPPGPFLESIGVNTRDLILVSTSERQLPKRVQRIYTFESRRIRPAGATYRHNITIDGDVVTSYQQHVRVPDAWLRSYGELRSKNAAAGAVDTIFHIALMIAAVVIFIVRLRRGDLSLRFLVGIAVVAVLLQVMVTLNDAPSALAHYDTSTSYSAFIGNIVLAAAVQSLGGATMLVLICGAGEVLYRERLPRQLAMPRIWTRKALASKRVFLAMILGYALVPAFMAYQVIFYLVAQRFGAWSPAEIPYEETLNSALPWAAVLFAGFFPAFSEEFLSRAFAIPFLQRFVRSRWFAILLAAFIWGFGHSTYPNQPFWIRGVEVGVAGIVAGVMMDRFGLLPLLIWHFTIDAVYTASVLFASGNTYYVVSAALSSLIFALPFVASVLLYFRNRGFVPDDDLTNATLPTAPPPVHPEVAVAAAEFPPPHPLARRRVLLCLALLIAAALAIAFRPVSPSEAMNYRITKEEAKQIARRHVKGEFAHVIALPVEGFRSWNRDSSREDGGAPGDFDAIAATYLVQHGTSVRQLVDLFRTRIEAGTWMVRFFTPMEKEEIFVEVDPRTSRVIGYHKYLDETGPGPSLPQPLALAIAQRAFSAYGLDANAFEVKETLTYAQPRRLDWLFHFDERTPLAPRAWRRVTVRVAGNEVTQFNKTVRIPESVYRDVTTRTLLNLVLTVLWIAGTLAALSLVIAGLVIASRRHGLPWRRALRWTLVLAIIPMATLVARTESTLFGYSTTVAWETFRVNLLTRFVAEAGLQIGLIFLALAGLEAAVPYALSLATREGRGRFGRSAVVAALTALAIFVVADVLARAVAHALPSAAVVDLVAPMEVALPLPALVEGARALTAAIILSGAVAMFALPLRRIAAPVVVAMAFCALLDPSSTMEQAPVMFARALILAVLIWLVARYVLGANPLAWPLFFFLVSTLQPAAVLLEHDRPDLIANGIALIAFALAAMFWAWRGNARVV